MSIDKDRESSQSPIVRAYFDLVDASGMTDEAFSEHCEGHELVQRVLAAKPHPTGLHRKLIDEAHQ